MKVPCILIIVIGLTVVNASIQDQYSDHRNNFGPNKHPNNHHGRNHPNNHGQNHHPNNFNCPDYIQIALENTARALGKKHALKNMTSLFEILAAFALCVIFTRTHFLKFQ